MMRDYKFRTRDDAYRRKPRRKSRQALRLALLTTLLALGYVFIQSLSPRDTLPVTPSADDSEVIELPLPPPPSQGRAKPAAVSSDDGDRPLTQGNGRQASTEVANRRPRIQSSTQEVKLNGLAFAAANRETSENRPQLSTAEITEGEHEPAQNAAARGRTARGSGPDHSTPSLSSDPVPLLAAEDSAQNETANHNATGAVDDATDVATVIQTRLPELTQGPFRLDYRVEPGDTLGSILESQGLGSRLVYRILEHVEGDHRQRLTHIRPGETIHLRLNESLELTSLEVRVDAKSRLRVSREDDRISAQIESDPTEQKRQCKTAVVEKSLYTAAQGAGIPDEVAQRAIGLFRHQINFAKKTRKGDRLSVLFDQVYVGDKAIETGPLLAVEITNGNKHYAAVRYTDSRGRTDYYSAEGEPLNKAERTFLRAPLQYTRISSGFSSNRLHPILRRIRPHTGVDFAAPSGRQIVAAADGNVSFRGTKGGYGSMVILRHGSRYETRYAHMMKFARHLAVGDHVQRGETIGYVGQSGLATGPHLHYEIRIDGKPVNPMTAKLPFLDTLDEQEKRRFRNATRPLLAELQQSLNEETLLVDAR